MPELPEVETVVRELNAVLPGRRVREVRVFRKNALGGVSLQQFSASLTGRSFGHIGRLGKFLLFHLEPSGFLVAHLRMTGKFVMSEQLSVPDPHHRVWFYLDDGRTLVFQDMRCFGTLSYVEKLEDSPSLRRLGVDPYAREFTSKWLTEALAETRTPLKHFLMDQSRIAGIGNIYACEVMFRSGLSPKRPAHRVKPEEARKLHKTIRAVLDQAIRKNGTTISDFRRVDEQQGEFQSFLRVYGREDEPCITCGSAILRIPQQQRSTFYCKVCQR